MILLCTLVFIILTTVSILFIASCHKALFLSFRMWYTKHNMILKLTSFQNLLIFILYTPLIIMGMFLGHLFNPIHWMTRCKHSLLKWHSKKRCVWLSTTISQIIHLFFWVIPIFYNISFVFNHSNIANHVTNLCFGCPGLHHTALGQ